MEETQISNRETVRIGCLVSVGVLIIGLLMLPASGYFFLCVIVYIISAFPLSLVGALIGKLLTKTQLGVWIGALVVVSLGCAWLFSNPNYYYCVLSD